MARTLIDLDETALWAAAEVLGTTKKVQTVNAALREIAERPQRLAALGLLDANPDFHDPAVTDGAWR